MDFVSLICLVLCHYYTLLIIVALKTMLKSGITIPLFSTKLLNILQDLSIYMHEFVNFHQKVH